MAEVTLNSAQEASTARSVPPAQAGPRSRARLVRNALLAVPILLFVVAMLAGLGFFFTQLQVLGIIALAAGSVAGLISLLVAFALPGE